MMTYSERYYQMGQVIRDTVKEAQEVMCGLHRGGICHFIKDQSEMWPHFRVYNDKIHKELPFSPPKSIGELCLEVAQERNSSIWYSDADFKQITWYDIQCLRRLLYRRPENHLEPTTCSSVTITNCPPDCSWTTTSLPEYNEKWHIYCHSAPPQESCKSIKSNRTDMVTK